LSGSNLGNDGTVWFVSYKNGTVNANVAPVQASVSLWSPTAIILTVPSGATTGLVKVITGNKASNGLPFMVLPGIYSGKCSVTPPVSPLQIATSSLQDGTLNQSYSVQLQATGGTKNYTWSLVSGSLPTGLSLSFSGTISGTPSSASGQQIIQVQVADSSTPAQRDVATLSIEISSQAEAQSSASPYSFTIQNSSGGSGYDGVGNVTNYTDSVNGSWAFSYDTLNRLAGASGVQANNAYPNLCWQHDAFGNRLAQTSSASNFDSSAGGANACPVTAGPNVWATFNTTNTNRIDASSQNSNQRGDIDSAGDITNDGVNSYLYDGEGRICAVQQTVAGISMMTQYLYDAEGNRVAKGNISSWSCDTSSNGFTATTVFVLGLHNEQMTELTTGSSGWRWEHTNVVAGGLSATYDADQSGNSEGSLYFHLADWLGTRRQQTDYAGNPVLNFTGLPYGDALQAIPVSNLDVADGTEHHFTGKERDVESGNDYFGARYYSSTMGRWLSPDWTGSPTAVPYATLGNPQTLNLYGYVRNNPLSGLDLDGHNSYWFGDGTLDNGVGMNSHIFLEEKLAEASKPASQLPPLDPSCNCFHINSKQPSIAHEFWFHRWYENLSLAFFRWGRLGGPAHRAAVARVGKELNSMGYKVRTEQRIPTPNGAKSARYVDVVGEKPNGDIRMYQIGRQNLDGSPVAREVTALDDIEAVTGIRPTFIPYNAVAPNSGIAPVAGTIMDGEGEVSMEGEVPIDPIP
jgi:RHS repeat-associated protein